jgi:DNA invertase Pin-like site-specific DNA recombinase
MRVGVYARVSSLDQNPEAQIDELRRYASARGWVAIEFTDHGVSGIRESRPGLDRMLAEARRKRLDAILVWSLDRLGRSLKQLIAVLDELQVLRVAFISLREGLDWTTPAGRLQAQLLAMIAEFERARLSERVRLGMARARAQGRHVGRPGGPQKADQDFAAVSHLSIRQAAAALGVSRAQVDRWRLSQKGFAARATFA